jgi:hypothetical protein
MILAVKKLHHNEKDTQEILSQIEAIKTYYGIKEHCLETLLADNQTD